MDGGDKTIQEGREIESVAMVGRQYAFPSVVIIAIFVCLCLRKFWAQMLPSEF